MKFRKVCALGLSILTAGSLLLAGCGGSDNSAADNTQPAQEETAPAAEETGAAEEGETQEASETEAEAEEELTAEVTEDTTFSYLLSHTIDAYFADKYEEAPVVSYWLDKTWKVDDEAAKVAIEFIQPTSDSRDQVTTLLATGEYPDVFDMGSVNATVTELYDQGVVIDLTDYVDKYMPNYKAWMDEHPEFKSRMMNDGKILQLYNVGDMAEDPWGGFMYRRDWLVKYGKNPETGKAFTGGWQDDAKTVWEDDVVFPSGGTDPRTISDWEFMFEAFKEAIETENIDGGYCFQNYYLGYHPTGDLCSSFGGSFAFYIDKEGVVQNGYVEDGSRAFLQCMNTWYEEGWMDPTFEERSSDVIWTSIDTAGVWSGKVGLWYGLESSLGNSMNNGDEITSDICVFGACQPVNDKYGDKSAQGVEPFAFFQNSPVNAPVVVSDKAEAKNLPALLTAIDYLYSDEGAVLATFGFSEEQQAKLQNEFYNNFGLEKGRYSVTTNEDGEEVFVINREALDAEAGLNDASNINWVIHRGPKANVDRGYSELVQHAKDEMSYYVGTGCLMNTTVASSLTAEQADAASLITNPLNTYVSQEAPNFVTGRTDIDDDVAWQEFVDTVEGFGAEDYVDYLNEALGNK